MTHDQLVDGLEERFDAVGHDIRLHSLGFDYHSDGSSSEWSRIYCGRCSLTATVTHRNIGGWLLREDGMDMLPVFDERCVGVVSKDVVTRRAQTVADLEHEVDVARRRLAAALTAQRHQR